MLSFTLENFQIILFDLSWKYVVIWIINLHIIYLYMHLLKVNFLKNIYI